MVSLTPEQRQLVEQAGGEPVRLTDPETHAAYYLLKAEVYERVRDVIQPKAEVTWEIPEGIRLSREAFFRDLPELLKQKKLLGKWVAYHRDERVAIGRRERDVIEEINRRGIPEEEFATFVIRPQSPEPEEITFPSAWL